MNWTIKYVDLMQLQWKAFCFWWIYSFGRRINFSVTFASEFNFSLVTAAILSCVSSLTRWMSQFWEIWTDPPQKSDVNLKMTSSALISSSRSRNRKTPIILLFQLSWSPESLTAPLLSPAPWRGGGETGVGRGRSAALWVRRFTRGLDPSVGQ